MARCPECGAWDTLIEERLISSSLNRVKKTFSPEPVPIGLVSISETDWIRTGLAEIDRVPGGSIIDGSLILIGGDPAGSVNPR